MINNPTNKQISNSQLLGWEYLGDGLFTKGDLLGYFTQDGRFMKERM